MKNFYIKTNGCKSNQLESAVIVEKLISFGYEKTNNISDADIYILNSCSVTETADLDAIKTLKNVKSKYPSILTVFTGCSAQLNKNLVSSHNFIDIILGNNDKFDIVGAIENKKSCVTDIFKIDKFNNQIIKTYSNTRGYLKIQDGCNNYCSYCTIPLARGNSRSNPTKNIIEQIKYFVDIGIKEVVLTGIHIGQWGVDFDTPKELFNLLEEIEKTDIVRYRLGSLNTLEINDNLIDFLSMSEKFCPHFHLSLQSLTDKTLEAMNRKYTAQSCLDLMCKLNERFNLPFLGSDIIVGFPNESDSDFENTVLNVKKSCLSNIHVFPYSIRNNTKAAQMKNQLPESVKKERSNILHSIAKEKYEQFIDKNIGTCNQVIIEKRPDRKTGLIKAVTKNYLNVYFNEGSSNLHNTVQNVKILNIKDGKLFCNIIKE